MRKYDDGLCSNQERTALTTRIFDAIYESTAYGDTKSIGFAIDPRTHEVMVCDKEECEKHNEWFAVEPLILDGEVSADAVLDLADQFCFVR